MLLENIALLFHKFLIFIWSYVICLPWYRNMYIQSCFIYPYNLIKAEFCFMVLPGVGGGKLSTHYAPSKTFSTLKTELHSMALAAPWSCLFIHLELELLTQRGLTVPEFPTSCSKRFRDIFKNIGHPLSSSLHTHYTLTCFIPTFPLKCFDKNEQ